MCPPTRPSPTKLSCELKGAEIISSKGRGRKKYTAAPDLVKSQRLAAIKSHHGERWPGKCGGREGRGESERGALRPVRSGPAQPSGASGPRSPTQPDVTPGPHTAPSLLPSDPDDLRGRGPLKGRPVHRASSGPGEGKGKVASKDTGVPGSPAAL